MRTHVQFSVWGGRRANLAFAVLVVAFVGVIARPGFLFANVVRSGNMEVYGHGPAEGLDRDMAVAERLLAAAPLRDPVRVHRLYRTDSYREFGLFAPSGMRTFGVTYPVVDSSFLTVSDAAKDTMWRDGETFNVRPLSAVIAHESSHTVLEKHFGAVRMLFAPAWKAEGYCDYVSGGHSVGDDAAGLRLLASGAAKEPAVEYFRGYLRVKYLLEVKKLTVDQVFAENFDTGKLDREALAALSGR